MTTVAPCSAVTVEATAPVRSAAAQASAQAAAPAALPSIHTRFLFTWLSVFTALTVAQLVIGPCVTGLPVLLRNLVLTGVVVPAVVYALLPTLLKGRAAVLRRRS